MKTFIATIFAGLLTTSAALAQAPAAPAPLQGLYIGTSATFGGAELDNASGWGNALTVGYNVTRNIAVEGVLTYTHGVGRQNDGQSAFINVVAGQAFGSVTPFVLVGVGAGVNGAGDADKDAEGLWNVGAGVAYNVTRNWQVDARYRYVDAISAVRDAEHVVSLGVNYKF